MYYFQAKTKDPQLRDEQQAVNKMTAQAYKTKDDSNNYLHVFIDAAELQIGDQMTVTINTGQSPGVRDQDYTYIVRNSHIIIHADILLILVKLVNSFCIILSFMNEYLYFLICIIFRY